MLAFEVPDVGDKHLSFGGMKVVIFYVTCNVNIGARSQRLPDEGAAPPAQHRHAADEPVNVSKIPNHLQTERFLSAK